MKVLLYFENQKAMRQSGIGRALVHQKKALELAGVDYTLDPNDTYDLAHINTLFFSSYKQLKKCRKKGVKTIVHGHSTIEDFRDSFRIWKLIAPIYNKLILRMYRHASYIITPTNYSKGLIENYKGVNAKVYAVSNGIKLEDYAYNEDKVKAYKEFIHYEEGKKVVICAGLYFERKGILDFFEVARRRPDVTFVWFGTLKPILTPLKILKAIKNKPDNVIMAGYQTDVLKGAFMAADAFMFLSKEETEGIVVLEALASRLPVILRDIPVFGDWLTDKKEVLKGKNVDEWLGCLDYVFNNDLTKMKDEGYKIVEERTLDKVGNKLKAIYEEVYNS